MASQPNAASDAERTRKVRTLDPIGGRASGYWRKFEDPVAPGDMSI